MEKKVIVTGLVLAAIVFLPGCMRVPSYKRRSLELFRNNFTYTYTDDGVTVCVKRLNCPEKDYLFNGRSVLGDTEGIYFSIYNLSAGDYTISPEDIGLVQIAYRDIQKAIKKTSTVARFSGAVVSGGIGASGVAILTHVAHAAPHLFFKTSPLLTIPGTAGAIVLGIVFLAHSIKSAVTNSRINKDLKEKILHNKVVIKPGAHYEGLIFVKASNYRPDFTITMHEKKKVHNSISFDVNLE